MRWTLGVAAACALVAATGACGSQITVPDQGIIVTGCQTPSQCYRVDCDCTRAQATADPLVGNGCPQKCQDLTPGDPSTCDCLPLSIDPDAGATVQTTCVEPARACIGRGVFCGGIGALCKPVNTKCDGTGDAPMLIPTFGMPALEPHCQYTDDVCCPGSDGGVATD